MVIVLGLYGVCTVAVGDLGICTGAVWDLHGGGMDRLHGICVGLYGIYTLWPLNTPPSHLGTMPRNSTHAHSIPRPLRKCHTAPKQKHNSRSMGCSPV